MNESTKIPNLIGGVSQQAEVMRYPGQCDEMINVHASVLRGAIKRPPTSHVGLIDLPDLDGDTFYHKIERDENERYDLMVTPTEAHLMDPAGNTHTIALPAYLQSDFPKESIRAATIADTTFLVNRDNTVMMDPALSPERDPEAMLICKIIGHKATYKVKVYDDPVATLPDFISELVIATDPEDTAGTDITVRDQGAVMAKIIQELQNQGVDPERDSEPYNPALTIPRTPALDVFSDTYSYSRNGPYLWIKKQDGSEFKIEVESSLDEGLVTYKETVQTFPELPQRGYNGFRIKVRGSPEDSGDDYWVTFTAKTDGWAEGTWEEAIAPGIEYRIDPTTMPYALLSTAVGVANFTLGTYDWQNRLVGDDESNGLPSFVGESIQNVTYHRGRLGLVARENIALSSTNVPKNFFRTSVVDVLDDDPIDTPVSDTSKLSVIKTAVEYDGKLILMAPRTQLELKGADILTNKTAQLRNASDYSFDPGVEPEKIGDSVYWAFPRGDLTGIWQYAHSDQYERLQAFDVSAHVPVYLPKMRILAGSPTEKILFALPDVLSQTVCVYQWFDEGGERVQGSWGKWTFDGAVLDVWVINHLVYFLIQRGATPALEVMDLTDWTARYRLDAQTDQTDVVSRVFDGEDTTITFPAGLYTDSEVTIIESGGYKHVMALTGDVGIATQVDLSSVAFVTGRSYTTQLLLSKPYYRSPSTPNMVSGEDFQVRYGLIHVDITGGFTVVVTSPGRTSKTLRFLPATVGLTKIGVADARRSEPWRFPVFGNSKDVQIKLENDTHLTSAWISLEWEGTTLRRTKSR